MTRPFRELVAESRERMKRKRRKARLLWACNGERCATCAYRPGTAASGDTVDRGLTRLRRALLDAAQPFYCHEPAPGAGVVHGLPGGELPVGELPGAGGERRLCIGHADALTARFRSGYYAAHPPDAPEVLAELAGAYRVREELYAAEASG